jgi:hypothetical protein
VPEFSSLKAAFGVVASEAEADASEARVTADAWDAAENFSSALIGRRKGEEGSRLA